jgi:hypothetical protein
MRKDTNMPNKSVSNLAFFIIGGTSKAGTTSVFNYLAHHPQICPSLEKETRFFLDLSYPLESRYRCDRHGPKKYLTYFEDAPADLLRLEATPDYLHSANTASLISDALADVRFVFILREPVSRMISWYRFGQSMNVIPTSMTFDEYIWSQESRPEEIRRTYPHPAVYALEQGRYSKYIMRYLEKFGRDRIHICFYEELRDNPAVFMSSLCRFAGLNEAFFEGFQFTVVNKGVRVKSPGLHTGYGELKQGLRHYSRSLPGLRSILRRFRIKLDRVYQKHNVMSDEALWISPKTKSLLHDYYSEEAENLRRLVGVEPPWAP